MAHRYFTKEIQGSTAVLCGGDAVHLSKVLRAKPGDVILLCDGMGTDYDARITDVGKEEVRFEIVAFKPSEAEPDVQVTMYIGYAKGERMDWAIQKAVELGAYAILPFYSEHSAVKPKKEEEKTARFNRIALEAAKQCGRGMIPTVQKAVSFEEMLREAAQNERVLFLYEEGGEALRYAVKEEKRMGIITGPEGGFSPREAKLAAAAGCVAIGLGPRILRSETAPAAALAAVMTLTGNLE